MEANVAAAQGSEKINGIWDHRHDKGPEAKILWAMKHRTQAGLMNVEERHHQV